MPKMGLPWHCMGTAPWEHHGSALWGVHGGIPPHVASMGLAGDSSLGLPWHASMGKAVGFHGLALGLLIGNSMEVLYG